MGIDRREFLRRAAIAGITLIGGSSPAYAKNIDKDTILFTGNIANERNWKLYERTHAAITTERYGVLVDTTRCIGCRRCEWACKSGTKSQQTIAEFEKSVVGKDDMFKMTRMCTGLYIVNRL
jgi:NAD-dependent dihydropyrimidine dehydrogenase PreA subunit